MDELRRHEDLAAPAVLVPRVDGRPAGRLNYPDGFVSADKRYLHFAYDDNRHRTVVYGAKLPPLP